MRMFASAREMYMSLPTFPISCCRLWISSRGIDDAVRAQQDDHAGDQQLQSGELRVVHRRGEVRVAAEQIIEIVDARLHVALSIADALWGQPRQKREDAR